MFPLLDLLSVVIPVYNEEPTLPLLLVNLREALADLPCRVELLFVNDGSGDKTRHILANAAAEDDRVRVVELSRNFGQEKALTAGLDFAAGDAVVVMDADLQDPPELIPTLVERYCQGYDIVYAQRTRRHGETWLRRGAVSLFYWLMRVAVQTELPDNAGKFRLMSRAVVDAFKQMREQHRFMPGMVTWLGFRQIAVPFQRPARAAGWTHHVLRKRFASAWGAITSFSGLPLRLSLVAGVLLILIAVATATVTAYQVIVLRDAVSEWISLACLQTGLSGITLVSLGLIGDYLARMYDELKRRPLYVIRDLVNVAMPAVLPNSSFFQASPIPATNPLARPFNGDKVSSS